MSIKDKQRIVLLENTLKALAKDIGTRLVRFSVQECSCIDQYSFCITCQAKEMLETLRTAVQIAEEKNEVS